MSNKKPTPVIAQRSNKTCPICGKRSYSPAGIHPQCAVRQADAPRHEQLKTEKKPATKKPRQRSWEKKCPKCHIQLHVRKKVCECGYDFSGQ